MKDVTKRRLEKVEKRIGAVDEPLVVQLMRFGPKEATPCPGYDEKVKAASNGIGVVVIRCDYNCTESCPGNK